MMNTIKFSCIFIIFIFVTNSGATAQNPDKLIYKGDTLQLFTNPMEVYFENYPDKRPYTEVFSTANWRGYIATWKIDGKNLYLSEITVTQFIDSRVEQISVKKNIFYPDSNVIADWYSGILIVPLGKQIQYVHMGYSSVYEHYLFFDIEKGIVKNEKSMDRKGFEKFKIKRFNKFKRSNEYVKLRNEIKAEISDSSKTDEFLYQYLSNEYLIKYRKK